MCVQTQSEKNRNPTPLQRVYQPDRKNKKPGRDVRPDSIWWEKMDSNHRSIKQQIYSLPPLATREFSHIWSWWTDLNPRPADYKSAALPTELHQRIVAIVIDYITKPQGVSTRIKQELPHTAMVEVTGLEPAASWSQTKHSTKLSYTSVSNRKAATCFQTCPLIIPHIFLFVKSFLQNTRKNQKSPRSSSKCACKPGAIMVHYKNPV